MFRFDFSKNFSIFILYANLITAINYFKTKKKYKKDKKDKGPYYGFDPISFDIVTYLKLILSTPELIVIFLHNLELKTPLFLIDR
uniref:CSON007172 protein n=1 Tax=Culicoides sonorensis TaxID=179676 RepID=A0A336N5Y3_CULSO